MKAKGCKACALRAARSPNDPPNLAPPPLTRRELAQAIGLWRAELHNAAELHPDARARLRAVSEDLRELLTVLALMHEGAP